MSSYYNLLTSETNPYVITNSTDSFDFSVQRTNLAVPQPIRVKWAISNGEWHILWSNTINANENKSFAISNTALLNELSDVSSGNLTIQVARLTSEETDIVTAEYQVKIDATQIKTQFTSNPTVSIRSTPIRGYLISGYSTARVTYSATKGTGAGEMLFNFSAAYGINASFTPSSNSTSRASVTDAYTDLTISRRDTGIDFSSNIQVTDSRGQYTDRRTVSTAWQGYKLPDITIDSAYRCKQNGTPDDSGSYVIINYSATYSLENIGNVGSVTCTYGTTTVTSGVPVYQSENVARTYIVTATDMVDSSSKPVTINMAKFPLDLYDDGEGNVGVGLGSIATPGSINAGLPIKTSYKSSIAMGSYEIIDNSTLEDAVAEIRMSSGAMGSLNLGAAYTNSSITIPSGWYNFIYSPHRSGGASGQASGDNHRYGNLLLTGMTNHNRMFKVRITSEAITAVSEIAQVFYGVCDTARATAAKTVNVGSSAARFSLYTGVTVNVYFVNTNSVASPTLNVNGTGAKEIYRYGTTKPSTSVASSWQANSVQTFTYDGTYWRMNGWLNSTYSEISTTNITTSTGSSAGTITGRRFYYGISHYLNYGEKTQYLSGLSGTAENATTLRVNIPIPPCTSVTARLDTDTACSVTSNSTQASATLDSVVVKDISPASIMVEITLTGITLTTYRHYMFRNGKIKLTFS